MNQAAPRSIPLARKNVPNDPAGQKWQMGSATLFLGLA